MGVISNKNRAEVIITQGIELLQNRGYDSAGIAIKRQNEDHFAVVRASVEEERHCVEKVVEEGRSLYQGSYIGIGHTRWATCGNIS